MYETTDLEVNTNGLEDEDYDEERPTWGQDEEVYNESAPVSVVNPEFGGVLPTIDVGNWERSAIPGAVATEATSSTDTGSAEEEEKGVDEGVFPVDDVNDATVSAVQKDRSAEGPSKAQEEQDEEHAAPVVTEEIVRNENTVFDDDWDWEDCFRDEYVGHLGCGINPGKERECDEVSALPVEATSHSDGEMKRPTVEAEDTKCAHAPLSRDEELAERSKSAEGGHSDSEDPADEELGTLSADAEMIQAGAVAGVAEADPASKPQVEEDRSEGTVKNENAPPLDRLFSSEELDLLMEGKTLGMSEEKEEYEKELEERLYPLDEVALKLRMEKNAEQQQELSLDEISSILNIPVETLARTRESSPGELSTPEYWLSWYKKTLAATEEARRANRNFQGAEPAGGKTDRVGAVSSTASDGRDVGGGDVISDELLQAGCDPMPADAEVDESVVRGNILICMKSTGTAGPTPKADSDEKESAETTRVEALPAQYRRLVRQVVHDNLKSLDAQLARSSWKLGVLRDAGWRLEFGPRWPAS
ncbi:hypothetical protein PR001_g7466 [Phytophthora rubi]|uniref:Uncharacterized protein n=1 Tax=Phytophthora rubi TaxID=129364 RepID=A0A6A3N7C1_9STRA|nr:hypothetical protein PR001_g7466 [Phytophthora rubi]